MLLSDATSGQNKKGNTFGIQKYPIIKYKHVGHWQSQKRMSWSIKESFKYIIGVPSELGIGQSSRTPFKAAKINDVGDIYPYLLPEERLILRRI